MRRVLNTTLFLIPALIGVSQTGLKVNQNAVEVNSELIIRSSTAGMNKMLVSDATGIATWSYPSVLLGGSGTSSSITYQTTSGAGATGADHIFKVGNNGSIEAMRILNSGGVNVNSVLTVGAGVGVTGSGNVNAPLKVEQVGVSGSINTRLLLNTYTASYAVGAATRIEMNISNGSPSNFSYGGTVWLDDVIESSAPGSRRNGLAISLSDQTKGSSPKEVLRISGNGNVGIGTAAPAGLLSIGTSSQFQVSSDGKITFDATNTAIGTPGSQTINKPSGSVNIAGGGTTITVTNSLVTSSSKVWAWCSTNDLTAYVKNVVCSAGQFVVNLGAAADKETKIDFIVFN